MTTFRTGDRGFEIDIFIHLSSSEVQQLQYFSLAKINYRLSWQLKLSRHIDSSKLDFSSAHRP